MRKLSIALLVFQLIIFSKGMILAQQVFPQGGSGSYRLDYPGWNYTHDIYAPIGDNTTSHIKKGPGYTGPLQTHTWWSSALWDHGNIGVNEGAKILTDYGFYRHSGVLYPYPMSIES
ncbi:MAG: hypothetical protein K2Q22_12820, partial [Cytophagales bacterium]|nr:hypothetical protein [Cytophagales bacterium]